MRERHFLPNSVIEATASSNPPNPAVTLPEPIHNCPQCSHWISEGTLACPECNTIVYSDHLRQIASRAMQQEREGKYAEARATWASMLAWIPEDSTQTEGVLGRIRAIDDRNRAAEESKARWTRRLGPLAPIVFFLAKAKSLIFLLFKFKFLLSFFAFFGIYWVAFGWKFGLGFTLSIMIHEFGHYVAARRRGLKADLPVFVPYLGAYVRWYHMGVDLDTLSAIALAGPFFGLLAATACAAIYFAGGGVIGPQEAESSNSLWAALAYTGAWLNLINLVPVLGLDGAQATHALNRTQRGLILIATIVFYAILHEGVFLFIAAGMAWRTFTGEAPEKPSTPTMVRFMLVLFLLGALMFAVPETHGRQF